MSRASTGAGREGTDGADGRLARTPSPVTPVDEILKHRHGEHVHVVAGQNHLAVLPRLQVDPLDLVRPGVAPVQLPLLQAEAPPHLQPQAHPPHLPRTLTPDPSVSPPSSTSSTPQPADLPASRVPSSPHSG